MQIALERVGAEGAVFGIDVVDIEPLPATNARVMTGDVRDPATVRALRDRMGRAADVVLSDMAPKLTGVRTTDDARSAELVEALTTALPVLLRPGGRLLTKVFMGPDYEKTIGMLGALFRELRVTRPESTRQRSAELFAFGREYLPEKP